MNYRIATVTISVLALLGCAANQQWVDATPAQRKVMFESGWNAQIGKPINMERTYKSTVLSVADIEGGKREYVIRQLSECQIALLVNNHSSVLLSWRYVSQQAKCAAYYYSPGA
jgi:hypothetical protein